MLELTVLFLECPIDRSLQGHPWAYEQLRTCEGGDFIARKKYTMPEGVSVVEKHSNRSKKQKRSQFFPNKVILKPCIFNRP